MRALLLLLSVLMLSILTTSTPIDLGRALANSRAANSDAAAAKGGTANKRPSITYQPSYLPHFDESKGSPVKYDRNSALRKGEYKCKGKTCHLDPNQKPALCGDSPCQHPLMLMDPKDQWSM